MNARDRVWYVLLDPPADSVRIAGREVSRGCRVRLAPRATGDLLDTVLAGRTGRVESIDQDDEGNVHLGVVLDDDPGRDLGVARYPGHRFFSPAELEPVGDDGEGARRRLLIAGIGNLFLGDDGFGVEVVRRLTERRLPAGVEVADFGIRGLDLVYALSNAWDGVILVDAMACGEAPGTLVVIEPELPEGDCAAGAGALAMNAHAIDPVAVLRHARGEGTLPPRALVVGCEPARLPDVDAGEDMSTELSAEVAAAVGAAVDRVVDLAETFARHGRFTAAPEAGTDR